MGIGASGFIVETLHLGKSILSAFCILLVFRSSSNMFFHFLAGLTKAMETPIPGEKPALAGLDLARVGLRAPPMTSLQLGADPSEHAPLAMEV